MLSFRHLIPSPGFGDTHYVNLSLKTFVFCTNNQIDRQCEAKEIYSL
jgi:hypothetical protein